MTDWPDDWFRDGPRAGAGQRGGEPAGAQGAAGHGAAAQPAAGADPTVQVRDSSAAQETAPPRAQAGTEPSTRPGRAAWPEQPAARIPNRLGRPPTPSPGPSGGAGYGNAGSGFGGSPRLGWRRWLRPRPIMAAIAILLSLAIIGTVTTYFYLDSKLTRKNVL